MSNKVFTVNKDRVLQALYWLKQYNEAYHDISINETNLSWMNGKPDAILPGEEKVVKTNA